MIYPYLLPLREASSLSVWPQVQRLPVLRTCLLTLQVASWRKYLLPVCQGCWTDAVYQKCACLLGFCSLCFMSVAVDIISSVPLTTDLWPPSTYIMNKPGWIVRYAVLSIAFMVCVLSYLIRNKRRGHLQRKELGHLFRPALPLKAKFDEVH